MNVVVTGGSGFLGRHVCRALATSGHSHVGLSSKVADLRVEEEAIQVIELYKPDAVIHLAARVGGIGANRKAPGTFWRDNLLMGVNVLEACRVLKVPKLVMVGTTCSYPKVPKAIPFQETEIFDGYPEETNAPYGIAKRALLAGAWAYRQEFGMKVVTLIPTNLYGPDDNFDLESSHVIPAMMRKMHEAKAAGVPVVLWGSGAPTRDFLYVEDAAEAIVKATSHFDIPLPVNLGSGNEIAMRTLAARVAEVVGYDGEIVWDPSKPDGQPRRSLDCHRAHTSLGWYAKTPLNEGLEKTYAWFLTNNAETKVLPR